MKDDVVVRSNIACLFHFKSHFLPSTWAVSGHVPFFFFRVIRRMLWMCGVESPLRYLHSAIWFHQMAKPCPSNENQKINFSVLFHIERRRSDIENPNVEWDNAIDVSARNEKSMLSTRLASFNSRSCHFSQEIRMSSTLPCPEYSIISLCGLFVSSSTFAFCFPSSSSSS